MPVGSMDQNYAVLPYRKTFITLDSHLPSVVQPWVALERNADQMATSADALKTNVVNIPGIGWQLRGLQFDWGNATELTAAQSGQFTADAGTATIAPAMTEFDLFAQLSLTGVTYAADVQATGSKAAQKRVAAGSSFDSTLAADQTAWPSPFPSEDSADLDRVLKSVANHEPEDALYFTCYVPGSNVKGASAIANIHFSGPAGEDKKGIGTGQYCLKLREDGRGILYEKEATTGDWLKRHTMQWDSGGANGFGRKIMLFIYSDSRGDGSGFYGSRILFQCGAIQDGPNRVVAAQVGQAISTVMQSNPEKFGWHYNVPQKTARPTTIAPVRVDIRRDVRAIIQVGQLTYPETGTLYDDIISVPFPPNGDASVPAYLYWWGYVPTGTTLAAQLFDADTGVVLSDEVLIVSDSKGGINSYTFNVRQRRYRVKITFTSNAARTKTPTLTNVQVLRSNIFETPGTTTEECPSQGTAPALPITSINDILITGQETEPSGAGASFTIDDFTGSLDTVMNKAGFPVKIETTYDAGQTNRSVLFRGYSQAASAEWLSGTKDNGQVYGGSDYRRYSCQAAGEWLRLQESMTPQRYTWFDKAANLPNKVTDTIRDLLSIVYPSSMVDVPDLSVRLFSKDQDSFILEPGSSVGDTAFKLAKDFLGAYLIFDENAGTNGMWRMLQQKTPPYINLAKFYIEHPGNLKLPHVSAAYGTSTDGAQTVTHTYIKKGSYRSWKERAEGNLVIVCGMATGKNNAVTAVGGGTSKLTQIAVNVDSYNFLGLDPGDPGYPDLANEEYIGRCIPIVVIDSTLTTQYAVDWVCRRVYDYAAHKRDRISFEAPLILVTDAADTEQTNPRPLRYYDSVQVQNKGGTFDQWLVLSCSPGYERDGFQFAKYELVRQVNIDDLAVMPRSVGSAIQGMMQIQRRMFGTPQANNYFTGNSSAGTDRAGWMALPEPSGDPIQDLDPTSPTFGQFYTMFDFDPLP